MLQGSIVYHGVEGLRSEFRRQSSSPEETAERLDQACNSRTPTAARAGALHGAPGLRTLRGVRVMSSRTAPCLLLSPPIAPRPAVRPCSHLAQARKCRL